MPHWMKDTASGMDRITIGNERVETTIKRKASRPLKMKRAMAYPAGAPIRVDKTSVIIATITLDCTDFSTPPDFRKNDMVSMVNGAGQNGRGYSYAESFSPKAD